MKQAKLKLLPLSNTGTEVITVQVLTEGIFPETQQRFVRTLTLLISLS